MKKCLITLMMMILAFPVITDDELLPNPQQTMGGGISLGGCFQYLMKPGRYGFSPAGTELIRSGDASLYSFFVYEPVSVGHRFMVGDRTGLCG